MVKYKTYKEQYGSKIPNELRKPLISCSERVPTKDVVLKEHIILIVKWE